MPYDHIDDVMRDVEQLWKQILSTHTTPLQWLQEQLRTQQLRKAFAERLFPKLSAVRPEFHTKAIQVILLDDAMKTSIGCSGETHVLTLGIDKVAGANMPVCWREMSDNKVHEYLVRTLVGGKGMDTARGRVHITSLIHRKHALLTITYRLQPRCAIVWRV